MSLATVQAVAWYAPYRVGGTEVYVEGLVEELRRRNADTVLMVPREKAMPATYEHGRVRVDTYHVNETPGLGELRRGSRHEGFDGFVDLLARHKGAIYHQHSWTRGCGPAHLRAAKEMGFKTVLTVHVPGNMCLRGTMRRFGGLGCDGPLHPVMCGACWLHDRGLPKVASELVARLPLGLSTIASRSSARVATALSARALATQKLRQVREMAGCADRVVAVCQWVYDALAVGGVDSSKLVLNRQGIARGYEERLSASEAVPKTAGSSRLELLYLGTYSPTKGITTAVRAVRAVRADTDVRLTIHAPSSGTAEQRTYETQVREAADGDPRIEFGGLVPHAELPQVMLQHDALMVPSAWLETGPLVVIEAQAAGLFILGSRMGGIAELVREPCDGELVPPDDLSAWTGAIQRLAEKKRSGLLRRSARKVRTMREVGADMVALYEQLQRSPAGSL